MERYIICPRCEINYILESAKLCDVCKAELKLAPDIFSEDEEDMILCPICKVNHIFPGEDSCGTCKELLDEVGVKDDIKEEDDEEWRSFLDPEEPETDIIPEGLDIVPFDEIEEEENALNDDEEEEDDFSFEDAYGFDYDDNFDEDEDYDDDDDDDDDMT